MNASTNGIVSLIGVVTCGILLFAGAVSAHHSFTAEFDPNRPVEVSGRLSSMLWSNPHAWIYIDVEGPDGEIVNWGFEAGSANGLVRRGWRPEDLEVGAEVLVEGWAARSGAPVGNARSIRFPDGRRLFAGTSNPAASEQ
jgi:hypothetical protein